MLLAIQAIFTKNARGKRKWIWEWLAEKEMKNSTLSPQL
jgi:hypothetical protein